MALRNLKFVQMTEYGYIRVAAAVPTVKIADVDFNIKKIADLVESAASKGVEILAFPELSVTAYTCGDLFGMPMLAEAAERGVASLAVATSELGIAFAVGCPVVAEGKRYNCAVMISRGRVLGIVPKTHIPNYGEFYERRWFESGARIADRTIRYAGCDVAFGTDLLFDINGVKTGIEICEDLWVPNPPSTALCLKGADVVLNLSASDELIGKHQYVRTLVAQQSARCRCAYVYSSAGWGESTTDLVFAGNAMVAVDGALKDMDYRFPIRPEMTMADLDVEKLRNDRLRFSTFYDDSALSRDVRSVAVSFGVAGHAGVPAKVAPLPFVPLDKGKRDEHCEEIFNIQARGLMQRLNAINCKKVVIGISGGLDSTLALLVAVHAFDRLGLDRRGIVGITMPGMATTSRTHNNAVGLMHELGVTSLEIPIGKSVAQHFEDIGQDPEKYDVTYENSQARERTQILMDYANKIDAIVVGTGDMSELALGWCTYNGDHISMYGVNASVPKTLVKHLVEWYASKLDDKGLAILLDIVGTPISPELVPSGSDKIGQKTEDLVGPYELHDFFMYHFLRNSFSPRKIMMLATVAFQGKYDRKVILKWLGNFFRRFFSQQFKRSCMPDGPKVGSVCLSPRGDWRMPSDASRALWMSEIESLENEILK